MVGENLNFQYLDEKTRNSLKWFHVEITDFIKTFANPYFYLATVKVIGPSGISKK